MEGEGRVLGSGREIKGELEEGLGESKGQREGEKRFGEKEGKTFFYKFETKTYISKV